MRLSVAFAFFASVQAFAPSPAFMSRSALAMTAETHIDKSYTSGSGMNEHHIPMIIENLSLSNFEESLEMLEPLLTNECVGDICDDYVGMLNEKAASLGKEVPEGFAASHH